MAGHQAPGGNPLLVQYMHQHDVLIHLLNRTSNRLGESFFVDLVTELGASLNVPFSFVTECTTEDPDRVKTLAFWNQGKVSANFSYHLNNTPCKRVIKGESVIFPEKVRDFFPDDFGLVQMNASFYAGEPLFNSDGEVIGHIVIISQEPVHDTEWIFLVLKLMALRASAELERKILDAKLQTTIQDLKSALDNVRTLRGLVPICASCKKIRDDSGYWQQVESYVARHTHADFTHGICPDCRNLLYPELQNADQ